MAGPILLRPACQATMSSARSGVITGPCGERRDLLEEVLPAREIVDDALAEQRQERPPAAFPVLRESARSRSPR